MCTTSQDSTTRGRRTTATASTGRSPYGSWRGCSTPLTALQTRDEADFFYIPLWIRNRGDKRASVLDWAKEYIREKFPYWKKYGSMRHFVLTNSDWGNCEMGGAWGSFYGDMHPCVKDLFTVTLWGMKLSMHMERKGRCFREGIDIVMPPDQDPVLFKFAPGFAKQLEEPIQVRGLRHARNTPYPRP